MMNPFEFVLAILLIVFAFSLIRTRMVHTRRVANDSLTRDDPEKRQLLDEVRQLKERVQVLERITVEKENSLARQIEELRDR